MRKQPWSLYQKHITYGNSFSYWQSDENGPDPSYEDWLEWYESLDWWEQSAYEADQESAEQDAYWEAKSVAAAEWRERKKDQEVDLEMERMIPIIAKLRPEASMKEIQVESLMYAVSKIYASDDPFAWRPSRSFTPTKPRNIGAAKVSAPSANCQAADSVLATDAKPSDDRQGQLAAA